MKSLQLGVVPLSTVSVALCWVPGISGLVVIHFCLILISVHTWLSQQSCSHGGCSLLGEITATLLCLLISSAAFAKRIKSTAEEQRWELQAGKHPGFEPVHAQSLVLSPRSSWGWNSGQKSVSGHYLLLWVEFFPPALEKWLNAWRNSLFIFLKF